ncbi:hypothetical protein CON63_10465 [Bacillus toyonensis]|nr:hypothetical protein CON63_10465 [Bacillus toyonensis]PEM94095.1 hypothetical protein CN629_14935 [Bacillus toyonensis]
MTKNVLTLTNGDEFFTEIRKCETSGKEFVVCYFKSEQSEDCCIQTIICAGTGSVRTKCKTCDVSVDCTVSPPTYTCTDGEGVCPPNA